MKFIYFFLMLPFVLLACKTQKSAKQTEKLLISMQRTACFGACPVYILEIYESGYMTLKGEKFYKYIGNYEGQIPSSEVERLRNLFVENKFFSFKESYVSNMTDLPSTYVYFAHEGETKKILDYQGTPKAIKDLEEALDQVIEKTTWKKSEDTKE